MGQPKLIDAEQAAAMDREFRAVLAELTQGLSPLALGLAAMDWVGHSSLSPGRRLQLTQSLLNKIKQVASYGVCSLVDKDAEKPSDNIERRMSGEAWQRWPFNVMAQAHQLSKDWWHEAAMGVEGVRDEHEVLVHAVGDHMLDMLSPANGLVTNPEVIQATIRERGQNLVRGLKLIIQDQRRNATNNGIAENVAFVVGEDVAATEGKVVFQNDLMELIQYSPKTKEVGAEPVLITPAWIMKYYILDLSPHNSLVKYLTEQGKTVFIISWKNPTREDSHVGLDNYIRNGQMAAIDAVNAICPKKKIHAVGYCIGGTLLSVAAATMARDDDDRLQSISLFAAQTDFTEAGEIRRFIGPSQMAFLEKLMWRKGYLSSENMGGAFSALHSSDLIHAEMVNRYYLGNESKPNDLMFWNADGTRMPYRMHSEYLQKLYMENQLARNRFVFDGQPISLSDIRVPMFVLGTETDHVAPWKSVYKIVGLTQCEVNFTLTSGGHNAGVVSGPEHPRRRYRTHTRAVGDRYIAPEAWMDSNEAIQGSWWPSWSLWLDDHMSGKTTPPRMGVARSKRYKARIEAPGVYVFG
jgi:polyhydroxyalkanoate synthase